MPRKVSAASRRRVRTAKKAPMQANVAPVSAADLRRLQQQLEAQLRAQSSRHVSSKGSQRRVRPGVPAPRSSAGARWNPDPDDVQRSVVQLVLTIVEFLRELMERQAIRRMDEGTLTGDEVEAVGAALMTLEETVHELGARFGLSPEDLNLDLGPLRLV